MLRVSGPFSGAIQDFNGETFDGDLVLVPGAEYKYRLTYSLAEDGGVDSAGVYTLTLPEWLQVDDASLAGNVTIESIARGADGLVITFKDEELWPQGQQQGTWIFDFTVQETTESYPSELNWAIGDQSGGFSVIIKEPNDNFANFTDSTNKAFGIEDLNRFLTVTNGVVSIDERILQEEIPVKLTIETNTPLADYSIIDTLDSSLVFVENSVKAQIIAWDENGLNQEAIADLPGVKSSVLDEDNVLTISDINASAPSKVLLTYNVKLASQAAINQLVEELQSQLDVINDPENWESGTISVTLKNSASFNGAAAKTDTVKIYRWFEGFVGPDFNQIFTKGVDKRTTGRVGGTEDGVDGKVTLENEFDVVYTLTADLSKILPTSENPNTRLLRMPSHWTRFR